MVQGIQSPLCSAHLWLSFPIILCFILWPNDLLEFLWRSMSGFTSVVCRCYLFQSYLLKRLPHLCCSIKGQEPLLCGSASWFVCFVPLSRIFIVSLIPELYSKSWRRPVWTALENIPVLVRRSYWVECSVEDSHAWWVVLTTLKIEKRTIRYSRTVW